MTFLVMFELKRQIDQDNHPSDDALEALVVQRIPEAQLEDIETHLLACQSCLDRLQRLELDIAVMKLALSALETQHRQTPDEGRTHQPSWLAFPGHWWIAAAALIATCVSLPVIRHRSLAPPEVILSAYRSSENPVLPQHRSVPLVLDVRGLPEGSVSVQVVNHSGIQLWAGKTEIRNGHARVVLPRFDNNGSLFMRLYSLSPLAEGGPFLLREFAFRVKSKA